MHKIAYELSILRYLTASTCQETKERVPKSNDASEMLHSTGPRVWNSWPLALCNSTEHIRAVAESVITPLFGAVVAFLRFSRRLQTSSTYLLTYLLTNLFQVLRYDVYTQNTIKAYGT